MLFVFNMFSLKYLQGIENLCQGNEYTEVEENPLLCVCVCVCNLK
jgi:hypothetical protein